MSQSKSNTQLVAGLYRPNSTMARLFKALSDGKGHTLAGLKNCASKKGVDLNHRLYWIGRHGAQKRAWKIVKENGVVKMLRTRTNRPAKKATPATTVAA